MFISVITASGIKKVFQRITMASLCEYNTKQMLDSFSVGFTDRALESISDLHAIKFIQGRYPLNCYCLIN